MDIASYVFQTPLYSFDDARAGRGTDEVHLPSKDSSVLLVEPDRFVFSAFDASLKRVLESFECRDNALQSRLLPSLLPAEFEMKNEKASRDATITATSVLRDVNSHVTSGGAISVSTRRRIPMAMVIKARPNTAVTVSFWRTGILNCQRSGRGNAMTVIEDD